jgi:hypothetical protein
MMGIYNPDEDQDQSGFMAEDFTGFAGRILEPEGEIKALRKTLTFAASVIKDHIKYEAELLANDKFAMSNDNGNVWSADKPQWTQIGDAIKFGNKDAQTYDQYEIKTTIDDFRIQLDRAHDSLFYTATRLNDYTNEQQLDVITLTALYGEAMAMKLLQDEETITRLEVREKLMYLLYFGIGGKSNKCSTYLKHHLNGRVGSVKGNRDSSLNHFVTGHKVVKTCVFKLSFDHLPNLAEQAGIDFVTATGKQTNINDSGAKSEPAEIMYYSMMLVLDPDFSAEEIRTTKKRNVAKPSGVNSIGNKRKGQKRKLQNLLGLDKYANTCAF